MRTILIVNALFLAAAAFAVPPDVELPAADPEASRLPEVRSLTPCVGGEAGPYECENVDLLAFLPLSEMDCGKGNDIWGWTDPLDGTEYALMGCNNGTAFVDLSDPENPVYLGKLPTHTTTSTWRDIKVYQGHAFVVSEAGGHGLQVFDLTELRDVTSPPVTFSETAHLGTFGQTHNVAINEDSGFAYVVGAQAQCSAGLYIVNIQDPANPQGAGCFSSDGYTHDAQCVNYQGPDADHAGSEICFASNEDTLTVVDVTDKGAPVQLARETYPGVEYTHQGWLTEDHRYFLLDDELDELDQGHNTRTRIWDVQDLDNPSIIGTYNAPVASTDHNQYVKGGYTFQSNYSSGLRILDLAEVAEGTLTEAAYFDTYPSNNDPGFDGTWSNYPYFDSGIVIVSGRDEGLFVVQPDLPDIDPAITVDDDTVERGNDCAVDMAFHVSMSAFSQDLVTVDYETVDNTAFAGVDYEATSGTLTFAPGEIVSSIPVKILVNPAAQEDSSFFLDLLDAEGATIARGRATGTILHNDETGPRLSVNNPNVLEGDGEPVNLQFLVNLSCPHDAVVSFDYETVNGTAVAGVDYEPVSNTANVPAGEPMAPIEVPILGNIIREGDRTLFLEISDPVNGTIADDTGEGTIMDDDAVAHDDLDPSSGSAAGGEVLLATGQNFLPGVEVEFDATPAIDVEVLSDTELEVTTPALAAGELFDVHVFFDEHHDLAPPPSLSHPQHKRYLADFLDTPRSHIFHDFVEILRRSDVSGGCGAGEFCVGDAVSRAQMSVFLLRGLFGGSYVPPSCSGVFDDVPCPSTFADWIEDLFDRGITGGCQTSPARYCPAAEVSRGQMAVFLLRALESDDYVPPACESLFEDVPCTSPFAGWIEELVSREITSGCAAEPALYCPADSVRRGQMAAFLVRTFNIPFLW